MAVAEPIPATGSGDTVLDAHVPRVASEWHDAAGDARWRVLDATLVLADISGFTALSERLARHGQVGAEELTALLGQCFAELLAVAYRRGGSLVKFGGDALLLLFDGAGHTDRGVAAALAMRATMRRVGKLSTSVGDVRLRMSLGVHTGDVHAFRVGASHHELLLVGPGPSTVVAMEAAAGAGEIVVSTATASRVDASLLGGAKGPGVLLRNRAVDLDLDLDLDGEAFPARRHAGDVSPWVPAALRDHLRSGAGESEHRQASIAFVHFDGTDDLLAASGPAWLADALDALVAGVQGAAEEHGVTFLGSDLDRDGGKLILVSGVPRTLGDDEGRLLRAVRAIAAGDGPVPVRIGVHRGPVFAGEVGPPYRRTFTVMGDAVNLAARLMAKAERGQVLATAAVLERSRTAFETTPLPPFLVKGKARPVQAFAVGRAAGAQETRRSARLPLVGREAELSVLEEALAGARAGVGRVVVLDGEVGVGKTRLVEEVRARAEAAGMERRLVQCEQYEAATPFFAVRLLLRAVLGGDDGLDARIAGLAPELGRWAPLVADVLGVAHRENDDTRHLEPRFRRERTSAVVADLLAAAMPAPALVAFEDVHWMDDASAAVLSAIASRAAGRPWLVLVTRRRDDAAVATDLSGALELALGPLDAADAEALVVAATGDAPLRPERRRALVERAGGNPLFLEELANLAGADETLPDSLEAIVARQLDRLPAAERALLRIASVLGTSFEPSLLAEVAGDAAAGPADALVGDDLLAEPDGRLRFRHRMLRDVAYGMLPHRRRQELHERASLAIEAATADPLERAEVLSLHCFHAGRFDDALRYARVAADRARSRYALVEAQTLYERALASARRASRPVPLRQVSPLWKRLGTVRQLLGDYAGANEAYTEVRRLHRDDPLELARMAERHAEIAERQGRARAIAHWASRGLRALDGLDSPAADAQRAHLLIRLAGVRYQRGHPRDARRWAQRAVEAAERSGSKEARAAAYGMLDATYVALGRPERATNSHRALELYRQLRQPDNMARLQNNLGAFAYYEGRWSDALRLYEDARANFEKVGNLVDAALGRSNIAEIFADQGRLDEAERLLLDVLDTWRSMSFPIGTARATRYLARVHLRRGDATTALALFDEARAIFDDQGIGATVHEVDVWRAECLLRIGELHEAGRLLDAALAREISTGSSDMRAMVHRLRAAAAAAAGRLEDAWAEIDESLHHARSRGATFDVALALETLAVLTRLGGRPQDEGARRERERLLAGLGVVAPPPPLPASVAGD